ncbi:YitT family protein [Eubacteriales bacterium OttesenSCG-928-N14]|nr:YitT family protein [Eubacteriales bacterium OttesenSCG-928-N14]
MQKQPETLLNKRLVLDVGITALGAFISAVAYNTFVIPAGLLSGGVTGIALLINYITPVSMSIIIICINIPLFLLGFKMLGHRFMLKTLFGLGFFSLFLEVTNFIDITIQDPLVAAIFGGALSGVGSGMTLYRNSSMGGTDIISTILNKRLSVPIGSVSMSINALVLAAGALLFGLEIALISIVKIFISSRVIDSILQGFSRRKTVLIISHRYPAIMHRIQDELDRGVTILNASGGYSGEQRKMLYCVVHTLQLATMRNIILSEDPEAFYSIIETSEVTGRGFKKSD